MLDFSVSGPSLMALLVLGWISLGPADVSAADWPRWRGPDNTGVVPAGEAVPTSLPDKPKLLWSAPLGAGMGSPVVNKGRVFCLDNRDGQETVVACDLAEGKELWHKPIGAAITDSNGDGPRGTPVADETRVYAQTCRGSFFCLDAAGGKTLWHVDFVKDFEAEFKGEKGGLGASRHGYTGPPLVDGPRILVGVGGRHGASVVAFDKASGQVIWKSQDDIPGYAGPTLAQVAGVQQVLSFTSDSLLGLDARDGRLLWRTAVKTPVGRNISTPVALDDKVVVSSMEGGLLAFRISGAAPDMTAKQAWKSSALTISFSSPVLVGHHLYGLGPSKRLFCADIETGKPAWVKSGLLHSPGIYATLLVMKDNLLVLNDDGQAYLIAADPTECRLLGSTTICGKNWCYPAYVDGKLLVRDENSLRCVQLLP